MSSIIDDYVTVPRSMVRSTGVADFKEIKGASETDKKKTPQVSPSSSIPASEGSSSSITTQSTVEVASRSDVKIEKGNMLSSKLMGVISRPLKNKRDYADTYLTVAGSGSMATSGSTSFSHAINTWQASEWTQFATVFQEYEVVGSTIHWDVCPLLSGYYTNASGTATTAMFNYGASFGSAQSNDQGSSVTTWGQFIDYGDFKMFDYGPNKHIHTRTYKPKACLVYNGTSGYYTNSHGFQPTIYAADHTWGYHKLMSSGTATGSSTIYCRWVVRYRVRFRGRKDA